MDDPATWDSLYICQIDGRTAHFERAARQQIIGADHMSLKHALDIRAGQHIALIGAGFGWIAEEWIAQDITAVAVDTSKWIHANKDVHAAVPVYDADCRTEVGRDIIMNALGSCPDWVISEDVLPMLCDQDCRD